MPYVFFDVETPNRRNAHICQIGVIRTDDVGQEEFRGSFYVNPQTYFDDSNIAIHGISPEMVATAPTLPQLWESNLRDLFDGTVLVAHNAKAVDLTILSKDLLRYDYDALHQPYLCTLEMARSNLNLPSNKLPDLAEHYGIRLRQHHDALADTAACAGVFWSMANQFGMPQPRVFTFTGTVPQEPSNREVAVSAASLGELYWVLAGVSSDGKLTSGEEKYIRAWYNRNGGLILDPVITDAFKDSLADGVLEPREIAELLALVSPYADFRGQAAQTGFRNMTLALLRGIQADDAITFEEAEAIIAYLRERPKTVDNPDFLALLTSIECALEDEELTGAEQDSLLEAINQILNPLQAQESEDEPVEVKGKRIVLTGQFETMERNKVKEWLARNGAEVVGGVAGKVDYLVVGGRGSSAWAHGNHGTKIRKALELQRKGKPIRIVSEADMPFARD